MDTPTTLLDLQRQLGDLDTKLTGKLGDIAADVRELKSKADRDYHALYGNGQPGVVAQCGTLDKRVTAIEGHEHLALWGGKVLWMGIAWLAGIITKVVWAYIQARV